MPTADFLRNFNRTDDQLVAFAAFSILTPSVSATRAFEATSHILCGKNAGNRKPREQILCLAEKGELPYALKEAGYRFYNQKAACLQNLGESKIDLRHCSFEELLIIKGFSFKTAPFFLTYSRKDSSCFIPDVHILRAMKQDGCRDIKEDKHGALMGPVSKAHYDRLNSYFNAMAKACGMNVAQLDYALWSKGAQVEENETITELLQRPITKRESRTFGISL